MLCRPARPPRPFETFFVEIGLVASLPYGSPPHGPRVIILKSSRGCRWSSSFEDRPFDLPLGTTLNSSSHATAATLNFPQAEYSFFSGRIESFLLGRQASFPPFSGTLL